MNGGNKKNLKAGDMISGEGYFPTIDDNGTEKYIKFCAYVMISESQTGNISYNNYLSTYHDLNGNVIKDHFVENYLLKDGLF